MFDLMIKKHWWSRWVRVTLSHPRSQVELIAMGLVDQGLVYRAGVIGVGKEWS